MITELTADVVAAYVSNNPVPVGELPSLIASLHASLSGLSKQPAAPAIEMQLPAVNPKKSVTPDFKVPPRGDLFLRSCVGSPVSAGRLLWCAVRKRKTSAECDWYYKEITPLSRIYGLTLIQCI
ncbi:MucR family transcriptional regulator [Mesorhizobium sp. B2-4-8]|uniref:MucR family transcriptional regulator n=1 Tax=Mesorhizobium sp. B2-4-8 TaxID=2589941 RepID=UPI00112CB665|nr:hypothetical protein FJ947_11030 [Mesorhizobium sp. B2-4-8]